MEKSQEQIRYENTCLRLKTGFYTEYLKNPNSVGAICKWLQAYGLAEYDRVTVGWNDKIKMGEVHLFGALIATYRFTKDNTEPIFEFKTTKSFNPDWLEYAQFNYHLYRNVFDDPYKEYVKSNTNNNEKQNNTTKTT